MIRRFFICFILVFIVACDDGDILTVDLDFEGNLERCDNFEEYHLIYDTREDPSESLILILPKNNANNALFTTPTPVGEPVTIDISSTNARFLFRTYNRNLSDSELCDIVPPYDLSIADNYEAFDGQIQITVTVVDDDNDGVPAEFEGLAGEPYEDGIYWDSLDTDQDGLPDYIDKDDDNDNVLTIDEIDNTDGDDDPTTNPLNTDGDLVVGGDELPDYLDSDDDGDNIPTYLEDVDGDQNPRDLSNYVVDEFGSDIFRYLYNHEDYLDTYPDPGKRVTTYTRTVTTSITIVGIDLEILRTTIIDFGTLTTTLEVTPSIFLD